MSLFHYRDLPQKPNAEAHACTSWLAHLIVRIQEEGSLTSPWSLMACVLLQVPATALTEQGLLFDQLTEKTLWLRKLALDCGAHLSWPGGCRSLCIFYSFPIYLKAIYSK